MMNTLESSFLAIDGGGTRCRVAFCNGLDVTVVERGSANVSTDFDAAMREVEVGVSDLAERCTVPMGALKKLPVYAGFAGVTDESMAARVAKALSFDWIRVEDDRPSALRGALAECDGYVAHCGTGSFVAAQQGGVMRFVGGWGPVLGDPASAQWVGRRALSKTLDAVDGLLPRTELVRHFLEIHGGAAGIVAFARAAKPVEFGAIAPLVTEHAARGDDLAGLVLRDAADEVAGVLTTIGWSNGQRICLTGGIGPQFADYLPHDMQAALAAPAGEPLQGAIALARDLAAEVTNERL